LTRGTTSFWDRAQTYGNLGVILRKQRRFTEAEAACRQGVLFFEKALAKSPSSRWMQLELAGTLEQLAGVVGTIGRLEEAEALCRRAIPLFDKFATNFPSGPHHRWSQAQVHFQHALLLTKLKRSRGAEQAYRRSVELYDKLADDFPTLPGYLWTAVEMRRILAEYLAWTGRIAEAEQVYAGASGRLEKLAASAKKSALKARGHFYGCLGQWDKAAGEFMKAIALGSKDVWGVWYPLAVLEVRAHRLQDYRRLCEQLLKQLGPTEQHVIVIICKLAPSAVADLSRPVHIGEKLVTREPHNAEYLGLLGAALYRKGDLQGAVARLEEAIRRGPQQVGLPWRKLMLAMAYHRLGRGDAARKLFHEVTEWMEVNVPEKPTLLLSWAHLLDLRLLHHEAEELLKWSH
jgi:tetratricopeptide (TPR) repeat protein